MVKFTLQQILSQKIPYIFTYGSLMWDPGFEYEDKFQATLNGYQRLFCVCSIRFRGTHDNPGLALGLDYGGECVGVVYKISAAHLEESWTRIFTREMRTNAYVPTLVQIQSPQDQPLDVIALVVNHNHAQHADGLTEDEVLQKIRTCVGEAGTNLDYLKNTVLHLRELGIQDEYLESLLKGAAYQPCSG